MVSTRLFCLRQQIAAVVFFVFYSDRSNTSQAIHRHGRRFGLSGIDQVSGRRISQITGRHIRFTDHIFFRYRPGIVPLAGDGDVYRSGVGEIGGSSIAAFVADLIIRSLGQRGNGDRRFLFRAIVGGAFRSQRYHVRRHRGGGNGKGQVAFR